jgi:thiol-disulfide isomerase/thioredoxin
MCAGLSCAAFFSPTALAELRQADASRAPRDSADARFEERLANQEVAVDALTRSPAKPVRREPITPSGSIWYGEILYRVGPDLERDARTFDFAVRHAAGVVDSVWFDGNQNGDYMDDPAQPLYAYPTPDGARSFIVDLRWRTLEPSGERPVSRKLRVILDPTADGDPPRFRTQIVIGRMGEVVLGGKTHLAMLMDGNVDGLYTNAFADGIFIDVDDDRRLDIDMMSPEFGPFAVPFDMAGRRYRCQPLDPEGAAVRLVDLGPAETDSFAFVGRPAPDFRFPLASGAVAHLSDWRGRWVVVYFWASWCSVCHVQADALRDLYGRVHARGLEIVGVSYDGDRDRMAAYRSREGQTWPTTFSGRRFWEDPVGRNYKAGGAGMLYLVSPDGTLEGIYADVSALAARLAEAMP